MYHTEDRQSKIHIIVIYITGTTIIITLLLSDLYGVFDKNLTDENFLSEYNIFSDAAVGIIFNTQ